MTSGRFCRLSSLAGFCGLVFPVVAGVILSASTAAHAQGTRLWSESKFEELERGTPNGVAVRSDGSLVPGPETKLAATTPSTYVWAVTTDHDGNAIVATGTPATVLRIGADGKPTTLFTSHDMSVQTLCVGPDGAIYAATLPSGKVYKIDPHSDNKTEENATLAFDPGTTTEKPKYVWDLAFDRGQLYIATGAPAAIYKLSPGGKPTLFFRSDEEHIRSIAFDKAGDVLAGSDGTGLIYKIDPAGKGYVLYDSPKKEITSVVVAPDGSIYAAGVGQKGRNTLPPLPVTGQATLTATITIVQPGSVQAFTGNTLIPEGSEVYEIPKGTQPPRSIWSGKDDIVYALQWTPEGVLAASGNRGRVYQIQDDGTYADVAHLEASQATGFADSAKGFYVGTANSGKVYLLSHGPAAEGTYTSEVFDAGMFAQWGRAEVQTGTGQPGTFQMYARAGNIENPQRAWGDWKTFAPNQGAIGIEPSRFMQWKVVEHPGSVVTSVAVDYLPVNMPPVVDEVVVTPGARAVTNQTPPGQPQQITINFPSQQNSGVTFVQPEQGREPLPAVKERNAVTVRWAAHDDNGDDMMFSLFYRGEGEHNWQLLRNRVHDRFYSFDATQLPDGHYQLKVVATDAPSHNPGEALTGDKVSDDFLIDTTPPVVSGLEARMENGKVHVWLTATDAISPVAHAEYSIDAGPWQYVQPVGKIADSLTEKFDFQSPIPPPKPGAEPPVDHSEHVITVRVFDREENAVTVKKLVAGGQ